MIDYMEVEAKYLLADDSEKMLAEFNSLIDKRTLCFTKVGWMVSI